MRLLLDERVPARLRKALPAHDVSTVVQAGWSGVKNGRLLALAATQFEAFVTVDKNLPYQLNQNTLPIAVLVLKLLKREASQEAQLPRLECGASEPDARGVKLANV